MNGRKRRAGVPNIQKVVNAAPSCSLFVYILLESPSLISGREWRAHGKTYLFGSLHYILLTWKTITVRIIKMEQKKY